MPLRILLLTQWFDPEPTIKGLVFARELVRQGFEVEVVTGFPNYPGGKLYPGYKNKWMQRELRDGVSITRVPLYPSHDQSAAKRILNYASFSFSALIYCLFIARRADVIYAYHPPLTIGIVASILRIVRRIPVVYDIQDMWPDTLVTSGMVKNKNLIALVAHACSWVYRRVDVIVVLSQGFKDTLISRGVEKDKIEKIFNWADEQNICNSHAQKSNNLLPVGRFNVLFAGNVGKHQALDSVLRAAEILKIDCPAACIVILGNGVEVPRLKKMAHSLNLSNVIFLPSVPMHEVGAYLQAADVLLVHLKEDPLYRITVPSKTQAYMAAGKPILMAVEGDAAELVRLSGAGLVTHSQDAAALAGAVAKLSSMGPSELREIGLRGKTFYRENLSISSGVSKFSKIFLRYRKGERVP